MDVATFENTTVRVLSQEIFLGMPCPSGQSVVKMRERALVACDADL